MADKIILADDSAFFVKTIDAPAALSDADLRDFVRTWLENFSPMSVDKMRFSYLRGHSCVTIFAGLEERVFNGFVNAAITSADYFAPPTAIFMLCGVGAERNIFKTKKSLAYIEIANGRVENFCAVSLSGDIAADLKNLRQAAQSDGGEKIFSLSKIFLNGGLNVDIAELSEEKLISGDETSGDVKSYSAAKKSLTSLDVRDVAVMRKFSRKRRVEEVKLWAIKLVPALFALLFAFQIYIWVLESKEKSLRETSVELAPKAKLIEAQSERLAELKMFSEKRLHSVESLAAVNSVRPDNVRFSRYVQSSPFDIELQGAAPTIGDVHNFVKALKSRPEVKNAELKTETARGEAKFSLSLKIH